MTMNGGVAGRGDQKNVSMTAQFVTLNNELDRFKDEKDKKEKTTSAKQHRREQLHKEQSELLQKNRMAQAYLGEKSKKLKLLTDKKARLTKLIELESRALQDCANHTMTLDTKERQAKDQHNAELTAVNEETEKVLLYRFNQAPLQRLSVRSVHTVVLPKLTQKPPVKFQESVQYLTETALDRRQAANQYRQLRDTLMKHGIPPVNDGDTPSNHRGGSGGGDGDDYDHPMADAATTVGQFDIGGMGRRHYYYNYGHKTSSGGPTAAGDTATGTLSHMESFYGPSTDDDME